MIIIVFVAALEIIIAKIIITSLGYVFSSLLILWLIIIYT